MLATASNARKVSRHTEHKCTSPNLLVETTLQGWDLTDVESKKPTFEFDRFRPHSLLPWIAVISRFHFQQKNRKNIEFWPSYVYFSEIA